MQPQMIIAVALCEPNKFGGASRQEMSWSLRFYVLFVFVVEDYLVELSVKGVVLVEAEGVLSSIEDSDIDLLVVVVPCYCREVMVFGLACLHGHVGACRDIIDVQFHDVRCHACHRIFNRGGFCGAFCDVNQRIVCHHALVHEVIGEFGAVGRPEDTAVDGELVTVNRLSRDDVLRVLCHPDMILAISDVQVVANGVCYTQSVRLNGVILSLIRDVCD